MSSNNPVGSTAMVDLFYNAGNLDKALNSDQDHWRDRFGKERITYAYMEKLANTQALVNQSRESLRRSYAEVGLNLVPGSFEQGGTLESETDVLLEEKSGKVYGWEGNFPKVVAKNTDPLGFISAFDIYSFTGKTLPSIKKLLPGVGTEIRLFDRGHALFIVKPGISSYPLINPQINEKTYLELQPENGEITTIAAGCQDIDDTLILNQAISFAKTLNASLRVNNRLTLKAPLDQYTYIRLPQDFTFYSLNPRLFRISIKPASGVVRDCALCLESFSGLTGAEPNMCSGTVCQDIYLTLDSSDGGIVKVGHCIIGAMFRTMFIRPYASGFKRHNILLCRAWYATIQGLFGRAGKGAGVTIGKHPDVNQAWDGAVNGIEIDEIWGHTNGQDNDWVADSNEDIGYGVGFYGESFSVHVGKVVCESNSGAGFQLKLKYGDLKIDSMYLEANTGFDFYSAVTGSSGISWQIPNIFLSQRADVKVKPDANTTASVIGFPFVIDKSNVFDFTGVSGSNLKLSRNSAYIVRSAVGRSLSVDYKIIASCEASLNTYSVSCKGPNPVGSLEFDNNCELVFIPYVSTTSTDQFVFQITKNGADQGTTLSKAGPFSAYTPVILTSWSGQYDSFYSFKVGDTYAEPCAGMFVIRARHL